MAAAEEAARQPTQEELQAYVEQMRNADAAEIVAQAFQILAMGAEVKLGRPDARTLIDTLSAIVQATSGRVPENLTTGMRNGVTQLQMAQVEAERQAAAAAGAADQSTAGQAADEGAAQGTGGPGSQPGTGPQEQPGDDKGDGGGRMTDRLWIPGR